MLDVHQHGHENVHEHHDEDAAPEVDEEESLFPPHLQKMCALLASVYAFFVLELCLSTKHKHSHGDSSDDDVSRMSSSGLKMASNKTVSTCTALTLTISNRELKIVFKKIGSCHVLGQVRCIAQ